MLMEISNLASLLTLNETGDFTDRTDVYFHSYITYLLLHITFANQKNHKRENWNLALLKQAMYTNV